MVGVVLNAGQFNSGLDGFIERFEKMFQKRMRLLVSEAMRRLIDKTPVNTGEAVMNYVASSGKPSGRGAVTAGDPVEATNHLALGAEKLRGPAAAQAMATLASVDFSDPFNTFWIVNKAPNIHGLEYGLLPEEPYTPRSPNGMFAVTVEELMSLLSSGRI